MGKLALIAVLLGVAAVAQTADTQKSSDKKLEGCLLREGPDFFLRPMSGGDTELIHLTLAADQDLTSLVGKRLRVRGSDHAPAANSPANAAAQPATPVEKQPAPSTVPSGTPDPNVPVTQLPQSAQAGDGTEGFRGSAPAREFYVSSFEPVSGSCPAAQKPQ